MPRTVQITVPSNQTERLLAELGQVEGTVSLQVERGASVRPPGDVISLLVTNRGMLTVMHLLDEMGIGTTPETSMRTAIPASVLSSTSADALLRDSSEASWEEVEFTLAHESNMTMDAMVVMLIVGVIAAVGIITNALHVVIGAMVIAPGFEPITRVGFGMVNSRAALKRGLSDTWRAYAALAAGAAVATLVLKWSGDADLSGKASYLPRGVLLSYWTDFSAAAILVSVAASVAGALLVAAHRSVLTAGVMIALALIPSSTLAVMGLVAFDFPSAGKGVLRWVIEVAIVLACSTAVFAWKRAGVHKRPSVL